MKKSYLIVSLMLIAGLGCAALAQTSSIPPGPSVLVLDGEYHAAHCPKLTGHEPKTMGLADAMRSGAGPCHVCQPNDDSAVGTFARTYAVAIGREMEAARRDAEAARAAVTAERARLREKAENERIAEVRSKAEAELKRREAEPLVRVTESQARAILTEAARQSQNDRDAFSPVFLVAVAKFAPEFKGPQIVTSSAALEVVVSGPLGYFLAAARERIRKYEPLVPAPAWSPGVHIVITPQQTDAPDIEKVIVQRNGNTIEALRSSLAVHELVSRTGAKRMIHGGEVTYPLSAFEPGVDVMVTVTAIPASGSNITRRFGPIDLRAIQ
jgi:hypothetical protein